MLATAPEQGRACIMDRLLIPLIHNPGSSRWGWLTLVQPESYLVAPTQLGEQPQDFQVQPHERYHQSESAVPLHVFGSAHARALFDEIEIEHQVERRDANDDQADPNP